jgi:small subunit ribosomal protein S8e
VKEKLEVSVWHGDMHKEKSSGGRRRAYRKKRKYEQGTFPAETLFGERKRKITRGRGGNLKLKILSEKQMCVTDPKTGKTEKAEIMRVIKNPANIDYNRRGVITKGSVIETSLGPARVTSRPGQHGILNAVLVSEAEKR